MNLKTIKHITFSRLSNAYHVSFMSAVKADIEKYGTFENGSSALGVNKNITDNFIDAMEHEQDIVNRARSSSLTPILASHDQLRDSYFRRLYYKLKMAENDTKNAELTPKIISVIQEQILKPYPLSITAEANQKETAKIRGFLKDIRTYLRDSTLELLDLKADMETLEQANNDYETTYVQRASELAQSLNTSACRQETEHAYLLFTLAVQTIANAIYESDDIDSAAKASASKACIDDINQLIKDFKRKAYPNGVDDDDDEDLEVENENENLPENAEKVNVSVNAD